MSRLVAALLLVLASCQGSGVGEECGSDTSWIAAALLTIETDRRARGDMVTLSEAWTLRHCLGERLLAAYREGGAEVSSQGDYGEALRLLWRYGTVSREAYPMPDSGVSVKALSATCRLYARQRRGLQSYAATLEGQLDRQLGPAPRRVYLFRAEYTPLEYAHSVAMPGEWRVVSGSPQRLMASIDSSMRRQHPVAARQRRPLGREEHLVVLARRRGRYVCRRVGEGRRDTLTAQGLAAGLDQIMTRQE